MIERFRSLGCQFDQSEKRREPFLQLGCSCGDRESLRQRRDLGLRSSGLRFHALGWKMQV